MCVETCSVYMYMYMYIQMQCVGECLYIPIIPVVLLRRLALYGSTLTGGDNRPHT